MKGHRSPWELALATFAIGLLLSGLAAHFQERANHSSAQTRINELTSKAENNIARRLGQYEYGLRGLRGLVTANADDLSREKVLAFSHSRDYDREFPGARGFGVIRRVMPEDEAAFVQRTRLDGWSSFAVKQLNPHDGERFLIQYIEPVERNMTAVGLDIASERNRRNAALLAMRTGEATLTGLITLVQASGKPKQSFLFLLPIYRAGMPLTTEAEREKAGMGWSYAPLVMEEVLADLELAHEHLVFKVADVGELTPTTFFQSEGRALVGNDYARGAIDFSVFGRHWALEVNPTDAFYEAMHLPSPLTLAGALAGFSALLAALVYLMAIGRLRSEQMHLADAHRAAIVESSPDAIIVESLDGTVIDWNPGAEKMFGYAANDAVGKSLALLLLPPERWHEDREILDGVNAGRLRHAFESTRRGSTGETLHVSIAASTLVDGSGQLVGISKVIRDIGVSRLAQDALADLNGRLESLVLERTEALNATLHDFRNILDALPSLVAYWDRDLVNRVANRAYGDFLGVEPSLVVGKKMEALFSSSFVAESRPYIEGVLRGEAQSFERSLPIVTGSVQRQVIAYYLPDVVDGEVKGFYSLFHDLTELKESRKQLAAAERNSAALLETIHLHTIVSVADRAGNIVEVNESFCAISGYSREELLGQNHRLINSGYHDPVFWAEMWGTISKGHSWHGELCNKARDGSIYWVDSIISPILGNDGEIEKFISIRTDITERKSLQADIERAHQRLEANEAFLRDLADNLPVRIAYIDREGCYQFVNETFCKYLGLSREEIVGSTRRVLGGLTGSEETLHLHDAVLQGIAQRVEIEEVIQDQRVFMDTHLVPDLAADGTVRGVYMVGIDITERLKAEGELRQAMALLNAVMTAASQVSIVAVKPDGVISVFTTGAEMLLGYRRDEVVGQMSSLAFHDQGELQQRALALSKELGRKVHTGQVLIDPAELGGSHEWTYVRKDGIGVPVRLGVTAMHDDRGVLVGYLGIAHDVRPQKELERSLRHAVHKERSANQAKTQFLANMSHEIRTPMNAVIGLSYLLERTTLDGEQAGLLGKIKTASKALLSLINNILDLSKIEASELKIEQSSFALDRLLDDVSDLVSVQSDARGIGFKMEVQEGIPAVLEGDSNRLHQVLLNLLTNAVKFSESGTVRLTVNRVSGSETVERLRFEVTDKGIGMTEEEVSRLFIPFAQADASTTRRFGGTGLGLSIVKQLVQLMGGTVGVQSEPGHGSRFWVELDLGIGAGNVIPAPAKDLVEHKGAQLNGVRVLVVDDSEINLEVARRILELEDASVSLALHGQAAVDQLIASPGGFDVVLLDLQMPIMDGFDTARQIRVGLGMVDLPLIALSASTLSSDMEQARTAGVNDFLCKPFEPAQLVASIRRCLHRGVPLEAAPLKASLPDSRTIDEWPVLEGIDTQEASQRLGGDQMLFRSMLKRLLREFGQMGCEKPSPALADLADLAARLHKLQGSAGTLGAKSVEQAAKRADKACRAQNLEQVGVLLAEVAAEMRQLADAVTPMLQEEEDREAVAAKERGTSDVELVSADALASLIDALKRNDLGALDQISAVSSGLKPLLGAQAFAQWQEQVDDLNFTAAAATLEHLQAQ